MLVDGHWLSTTKFDRRALALYERHYSCRQYADGRERRQFMTPGQTMVLLTGNCDALFAWHRSVIRRWDGQEGVNCAVFRNESPVLSSELIRDAVELAWQRWPGERLFTYVDASKIRSSNPGACFKKAGWRRCGTSKAGLVILEILPEATDGARPVAASSGARVPELTESPGEVVHPGALTRVVPSGARVDQAPRSGVQPTCHSPEITEEETLSTNGFATPAELSKKNGRRRAVNTATAKERMKHE